MTIEPGRPPGLGTSGAVRPRVVLTIGKLDGMHAGHRHLAAHVQAEAARRRAVSGALVLHPDPTSVLEGRRVPLLTTIEERCARLRAFGLQLVEPLRFTRELAGLEPAAFLDRVNQRFDVVAMVVGPDFAFGRGRSGGIGTLEALAALHGFGLEVVPPLEVLGEWISSRRLRTLVQEGDIRLARTLMRRPPRLVGTVIHGAARGRTLGFPTANLDLSADFAVPADGIYTVRAAWREVPERRIVTADGVASVGVRPTFDNGARLVEVHLLDTSPDLYGRELTVDFLARQRAEERFESVDALVRQMRRDVARARCLLARQAQPDWETTGGRSTIVVRGWDLADLCTAGARALCEADGANRPSARSGEITHTVSLTGSDDDTLLREWIARVFDTGTADTPPGSGAVHAEVYHVSGGALHGKVVLASEPDGATGTDRTLQIGAIRRKREGNLEVELKLGRGLGQDYP